MAFKLTSLFATMALIASIHGKAIHYRQYNATVITPVPFSPPSGTGFPFPTGTGIPITGTGLSFPNSSTPFPTGTGASFPNTTSFGFPTGTGVPWPTGTGIPISIPPSSLGSAPPVTSSSLPAPSSGPSGVPLPLPTPTSLPEPQPKYLNDLAIAFEGAGCNTDGNGPQYAWPNFQPGQCAELFPNPTYNFSSLWVQYTSRIFDSCVVTVYSDNHCTSPVDGDGIVYTGWGGCVDAADTAGKSFTLDCYNLPIPNKG